MPLMSLEQCNNKLLRPWVIAGKTEECRLGGGGELGSWTFCIRLEAGQTLRRESRSRRDSQICVHLFHHYEMDGLRTFLSISAPVTWFELLVRPLYQDARARKGVSLKARDSRKKRKSLDSGHIYSMIQQALTVGLLSAQSFPKSPY